MAQDKGAPDPGNGGKKKPSRASTRVQAGTAGGVAPVKTAAVKDRGKAAAAADGSGRNRRRNKTETNGRDVDSMLVGSELGADGFARGTLTCVKGPEEGLQLTLIEGVYTIGRARENNFVLKDIAASRKHVRIEVEAGVVRVVDLGSGNGTKLNGKKVSRSELRTGDRIELGSSTLVFSSSRDDRSLGSTAARGDERRDNDRRDDAMDEPEELDESRQQIMAAAERLAAELSQRMSPALSEEASALFTRGERSNQSSARSSSLLRQGGEPLWSETGHIPLSEIMPASEPLRGARPQTQTGSGILERRPSRVEERIVPRAPSTQSQALDLPDDAASPLTSALLAAFVVFVLGGVVLGAYWWFVVREGGPFAGKDARQSDYETQMYRAEAAAKREDRPEAFRFASSAYELKPDGLTKVYLDNIRARLDNTKGANEPAPSADPTPPQPVAVQSPQPKPSEVTERPEKPHPQAVDVKPTKEEPVKKRPAAKPLTEDEAETAFEEAVEALKQKDTKGGCKLLERVKNRAPAASVWKGKAESLHARRCE